MPKTLLLADDSVTIQKVVGISFANEDIEITTVDNGRDAVAKARAIRPDIILADVVMPGMSGYEVCETIKADPNLRHVPVLLLTGTFEAFDQARAAAVGAAGHVAKPFEAQTLVDRVKQLLAAAPVPRPAPAARPAVPAPAPAARPAPAPAEDAFDFFSDAPEQPAATPPPVPASDPLDFDGPDGAFAFGDDDLGADFTEPPRAVPAAPERRPDMTIAMLPDPPTTPDDDAFEFSFAGDRAQPLDEPIDADQLAHTTLLDPAAASGFDVSSSDLSVAEPAAATQIFAMDDGPQSLPLAAEDAELDLAEAEPFDAPELDLRASARAADPFATTISPLSRETSARDDSFDRFERDAFEDAPMVVGEPLHADVEDAELLPRPYGAEPQPAHQIEDEPWDVDPLADSAPLSPAPAANAAAPGISRAELHDMIEKIAWDAFAPVTEKIVRESLARIEQIVWEVVPKLAESLIQEEIRRLKGESE